jgi:hypothetical protein
VLLKPSHQTGCSLCGETDTNAKYRVLVAFSRLNRNACVVAADKHFLCDSSEAGIDAGDIWESGKHGVPDHGLWVWVGRIVYTTTPNTPDGPSEFDVDYIGEWREPTAAEWLAIMHNVDPFGDA